MDGIEDRDNIIVIGTTNRQDILDPAILRPGRFDRILNVPLPNEKERIEILEIHTRDKPLDPESKLVDIAKITEGFSGASLEQVTQLATSFAWRRQIKQKNTNHKKDNFNKKQMNHNSKNYSTGSYACCKTDQERKRK